MDRMDSRGRYVRLRIPVGQAQADAASERPRRRVRQELVPWSRRRVFTWTAAVLGSGGILKLALRAAGSSTTQVVEGNQESVGQSPSSWSPPVKSLTVAVPESGWYASTQLVRSAVERVLSAVNNDAAGRFVLDLLPVVQPVPRPGYPLVPQTHTIAPLLGSGAAPDLLVFTNRPSPAWVPDEFYGAFTMRWLRPLDDHLKTERSLALRDFYPAALDTCRHHGQLFGIPLTAAPLQLLYDTTCFARAQLPQPTRTWNWGNFREAAHRLTRGNDDGGEIGFVPGPPRSTLLTFIWQNGGDVVSADGKRALLANPAAVQAMEFCADFYRGGRSADDALECASPTEPSKWQFDADGMHHAGRWRVGMMYRPEPIWSLPTEWPLNAAELPMGKHRATALAVNATLSVHRGAKDPSLATAALALLAEHVTKAIVPPPRRQSIAGLQAVEPALTRQSAEMLTSALEYSRVLSLGDLSKTTLLHDELTRHLVTALQFPDSRGRRPAETAEATAAAVQKLLDRP